MAGLDRGRFRLLGFPLTGDPGLAIVLMVSATSARLTASSVLVLTIGGVAAVICHELGHALAARWVGAQGISIRLRAWGGVTNYRLAATSRWREIAIGAAGPVTGLLLGVSIWLVRSAGQPLPGSVAAVNFHILLFVTVGWSLLNLVPIFPLDGGRLLWQMLPGSEQNRTRTTAVVSIAAALAAVWWAWRVPDFYAVTMFGLAAGFNAFLVVVGVAPGSTHRHGASCDVFRQVSADDYDAALALVRSGRKVHPALGSLVLAVTSADQQAVAHLWQHFDSHPDDQMSRSCLMIWRARNGDWPGVLAMCTSGGIKYGAVRVVMRRALSSGAFVEGATFGEAALRSRRDSLTAMLTAWCWSHAGKQELALAALMRAVNDGWTDMRQIDTSAALAPLRSTDAFVAWRRTVTSGSGPVPITPLVLPQ